MYKAKWAALFTLILLPALITTIVTASNNTLIRITNSGVEGNGNSTTPAISVDGRYIAFASDASNLVENDTNSQTDVFLKDTSSGTITRVSTDSSGNQGTQFSNSPAISADGRYVAFNAYAAHVPEDTNGRTDIYLKDIQTGETKRVSLTSTGEQIQFGNSWNPSVSANGRYVAFRNDSHEIVPEDTNDTYDVFVNDTQTNTITRVSTNSSGDEGDKSSSNSSISADGRYVAFESWATNLVAGDTNNNSDIFLKDTSTGSIQRVSVSTYGAQGDQNSSIPKITTDGRYIIFQSYATTLVPYNPNVTANVFIRDTQNNTTKLASSNSSGSYVTGNSDYASISDNGNYAIFVSSSSTLVAQDTNGEKDIFLKNIQTGQVKRISISSAGNEAIGGYSQYPFICANGKYVVFSSSATNLVANDTNTKFDIFALQRDIESPSYPAISSSTHPFQNKFYRNNDSLFNFPSSDDSIILGYSYLLDENADSVPDTVIETSSASVQFSGLSNGIKYFHSRAIDDCDNAGPTSHFKFYIDSYKPKTYAPKRAVIRHGGIARLYWKVYDPYTGGRAKTTLKLQKRYDRRYRTIKYISYSWTTINKTRYYRQRFTRRGTYRFLVYSKDKAGNGQRNIALNYIIVK